MPVPSERNLKAIVSIAQLEAGIRRVLWLTAHVRQCATWQDPNAALIALIIWNASCLLFWTIVIYALPALPLLWAARTWPNPEKTGNTKASLANSSNNIASSASIHTVVDCLVIIEGAIQSGLDALSWTKNPARSRRTFILLMYFYVFWVTAHRVADTRYILAVIGTLILTWQSPWLRQLRESAKYPISIFTAVFLGPLQELGVSSLMQRALTHQENVMRKVAGGGTDFTFVLVENQRSLGQWQSTNLPFDRAPWTDESNQPVPSKTFFELPESWVQPANKELNYQTSLTWRWIDKEWRLEQNNKTDELGWEYGTIMWTMFDRMPKGITSTRRRRWTRRATLEYRVETPPTITTPLPEKPVPSRIQIPSLPSTNSSNDTAQPYAQSTTGFYHDTEAMLSPGSHFVDSFTSPTTSPRMSTFSIKADSGRRDTFGNHRQSQSSVSVAGESAQVRRRATSVYTGQMASDTFVSLDTPLQSSTNVDRRASRDGKRSRDAIWKSIVRN